MAKEVKKVLFTSPSFDLLFHRPSSAPIAALINLLSPNWKNIGKQFHECMKGIDTIYAWLPQN